MVDQRFVLAQWIITQIDQERFYLILDLIVISDIIQTLLVFSGDRELQGSIQLVDKLS